jgi:hypothetical protein
LFFFLLTERVGRVAKSSDARREVSGFSAFSDFMTSASIEQCEKSIARDLQFF